MVWSQYIQFIQNRKWKRFGAQIAQNFWLHACFLHIHTGATTYKWVCIFRYNTRLAFSHLVPYNHLSLQKHYKVKTQTCLFLATDITYMDCDSIKHRIYLSVSWMFINTWFIYQFHVMDVHKWSQWYSVVRLSYPVPAVLILFSQSLKQMIYDVDHSLNCSLLHSRSFQLLGCSHPPVLFHLLQAISNYGTWIWQAHWPRRSSSSGAEFTAVSVPCLHKEQRAVVEWILQILIYPYPP